VGSTEGFGVGVDKGVGVGDGVAIKVAEGVGVAFGAATRTTPLFHASFFPDLMHVKTFPFDTFLTPNLEHDAPDFGAAAYAESLIPKIKLIDKARVISL
jgi:hypothetical protein